jgi:hypothetical protein
VPYAVEATLDEAGRQVRTFSGHLRGLDFFLDPNALDPTEAARVRDLLQSAADSLDQRLAQQAGG